MEINLTNYKSGFLIPFVGLSWVSSQKVLSFLWSNGLFYGIGSSAIVLLLFSLYEKYLWKLPILEKGCKIPNLIGTYKGHIDYYWDGKNQKKDLILKIEQNCSTIKISTEFSKVGENNTSSKSMNSIIRTDEMGDHTIYLYYQNLGSEKNGDTLNQHNGVNVLDVEINESEIILKGFYFTDRDPQTKGQMIARKEIE